MSFRLEFDKSKLMRKVDGISEAGLEAVGQQALKNMEPTIPQDSKIMMESGIAKSEPNKLSLEWDTPYAKKNYYGLDLNFSTDHASKPTAMWAQKDWDKNKGQYVGIIEKTKQRGL
jgi:hypothetical protein